MLISLSIFFHLYNFFLKYLFDIINATIISTNNNTIDIINMVIFVLKDITTAEIMGAHDNNIVVLPTYL